MSRHGKVSIISAGLVTPITLFTSGLVAWLYRSSNPDNIDITTDLAYLKPIVLTLLITFAALWLISLITGILAVKNDKDTTLGKLGLLLLALVTIFSFLGAVAQDKADEEVNAVRKAQQVEYLRKLEKL